MVACFSCPTHRSTLKVMPKTKRHSCCSLLLNHSEVEENIANMMEESESSFHIQCKWVTGNDEHLFLTHKGSVYSMKLKCPGELQCHTRSEIVGYTTTWALISAYYFEPSEVMNGL